jgi:hypothetical protein
MGLEYSLVLGLLLEWRLLSITNGLMSRLLENITTEGYRRSQHYLQCRERCIVTKARWIEAERFW